MDSKKIRAVLNTLMVSKKLITNMWQFASLLDTPAETLVGLKRKLNSGTDRDCFQEMLEDWRERNGEKATLSALTVILHEMECTDVAEQLEAMSPTDLKPKNHSPSTNLFYKISPNVQNFVGREKEIESLKQNLNSEMINLIVITGHGGEGKTQLVRKWAHSCKNEPDFPDAIWLSGDKSETLINGIYELGKSINPKFPRATVQEMLEQIKSMLNGNRKFVWIIDDVNNVYSEFTTFVKFIVKNQLMRAIVTSRTKKIFPGEIGTIFLPLKSLETKDALNLVETALQPNSEGKEQLCETMGNHPLALQLAIGTIKKEREISVHGQSFKIKKFLETFEKKKAQLLNTPESSLSNYERTVLANVTISMELMSDDNQLGIGILAILSILRNDGVDIHFIVDIVSHLFKGLENTAETALTSDSVAVLEAFNHFHEPLKPGEAASTQDKIEAALKSLKSVSLIECEESVVSIHNLIQESIRVLFEDWRFVVDTMLTVVDLLTNCSTKAMHHFLHLWRIVENEKTLLKLHASKWQNIFLRILGMDERETALRFIKQFQQSMIKAFGDEPIVEVLHTFIISAQFLDNWDLETEALEIAESALAEAKIKKADVVIFACQLFQRKALMQLGKTNDANRVLNEIYYHMSNSRLPLHEKLKMALDQVSGIIQGGANVINGLLNFNLEENLRRQEREVGPNHSNFLLLRAIQIFLSIRNVGFEQPTYEIASLLNQLRESLGENHGFVMQLKYFVPCAMTRIGNYQEALQTFDQFMREVENCFGARSRNIINFKVNYVKALIGCNDLEKGRNEFCKVLEIRDELMGRYYDEDLVTTELIESMRNILPIG